MRWLLILAVLWFCFCWGLLIRFAMPPRELYYSNGLACERACADAAHCEILCRTPEEVTQ